jgi:hypothetical protein
MRQSPKQSSSQVLTLLSSGHFSEVLQSDRSANLMSYPLWIVCPKGQWRNHIARH